MKKFPVGSFVTCYDRFDRFEGTVTEYHVNKEKGGNDSITVTSEGGYRTRTFELGKNEVYGALPNRDSIGKQSRNLLNTDIKGCRVIDVSHGVSQILHTFFMGNAYLYIRVYDYGFEIFARRTARTGKPSEKEIYRTEVRNLETAVRQLEALAAKLTRTK